MQLTYVVACKVGDSFFPTIQGLGLSPLILFEDKASDSTIGFIGDGLISSSEVIFKKNLTQYDVISKYIEVSGLSDFRKVFNTPTISNNFLFELITGTINQDLSDFRYENDRDVDLIIDDEINDKSLALKLDQLGVWALQKEISNVTINIKSNAIFIGNECYRSLGSLVNEVILCDPDKQILAILS